MRRPYIQFLYVRPDVCRRLPSDLEHSIVEQETLECLFDAIDALPERYRRIFDLSFEKGLRNTEVAELLNVSTRAVTKQKARMIELVEKHMRKQSE